MIADRKAVIRDSYYTREEKDRVTDYLVSKMEQDGYEVVNIQKLIDKLIILFRVPDMPIVELSLYWEGLF